MRTYGKAATLTVGLALLLLVGLNPPAFAPPPHPPGPGQVREQLCQVTSVSIQGPSEGAVGESLTFQATAKTTKECSGKPEYNWTLQSAPEGAGPWSATGQEVSFTPKVAGEYILKLEVTADSNQGSAEHRLTVLRGSEWEDLGGSLTSGPTAASWGSDRLDVFVRGPDGGLWWKGWNGTLNSWNEPDWTPLGWELTSAPDCVSRKFGTIDCFVRGPDGGLWQTTGTLTGDGMVWDEWQALGGSLTSGPTAASWGENRLDVFVRGSDNGLWWKGWDGTGWGDPDWTPLGGELTSDPDCVSRAVETVDCFARGPDNGLWHIAWDGSWGEWEPLGGTLTSGPTAVALSFADGHTELWVFASGPDNTLWNDRWSGSEWSGWFEADAGITLSSDPDCVWKGLGKTDCFIRGQGNTLWHKAF